MLSGYRVRVCEEIWPRTPAATVVEERSRLLRETTRFVAYPLVETLEHGNTDPEHETHSDSADSLPVPLLISRSADDIEPVGCCD
ncbi:hypothetical protein NDU88_001376 [Pleurodeles waltl]|uniref:Uncharacterized protein n=1 Tax=Pleurodeles waltl TaxID=8319 RepID=A0AAV7TJY2_PLEWA|nr:hypothetical protein NDU88_001376 [Pleurodeles waltl]